MNTPTLHEYLTKKLEQKRKEHPSFRLMEIDDRLFPNAQTKHSTLVLEARNSTDELKTVAEIVTESWKKGDKNHLMIEGEGGIGKTVTLLSIPDKFTPFLVPAIYIPLHELPQGDDPIERYIKKKVLSNKEDFYGQLLYLLEKPWDKGPQLLLLLDGFNEIAAENRQTISEDIKYWSEFQGIQIVTSSRYDIHTYVALSYDYSAIKLQPLSNTTVDAYLKRMKVRIPTDSAVKELINIPFLLTLYVKAELILEQRETDSAEFREAKNAGSIVWKYLQCELWHFGKENQDAKNAIIAMEFIAPYMAWQMQPNSLFILDKKEFHKFLGDAYTLLENHSNKPDDFPFQMKDVLQKADGIPSLETIRNLLENHLCLFVKNGNSYKLMHQQFRDALAAMHLINSIYLNGNTRPTEWNSTIDHYVMQFVTDLINEEEANRLWEQNRTSPQLESATRNQLELQRRLHSCNFSKLNFSGLDLSIISLYPYRYINTTLKLPNNADNMKMVKISEKTFSAEGHDGSVNAVAITPNGEFIVSGAEDCTIRVWDFETGSLVRTLYGHNKRINTIAATPNGKYIISGADDRTIRIWDLKNGALVNTIKGHEAGISAVAVTPNCKYIVSGSKDCCTIRIWDIETGRLTRTLEVKGLKSSINSITITPNGKYIVSGGDDRTIRIWESETGNLVRTMKRHKTPINAVTVTPDSNSIICGTNETTISVWDLETGKSIRTLKGHRHRINALTVTPNSKFIVSGASETNIHIWDSETGCLSKTLKGHSAKVNAVTITPNGKFIVSGSNDCTIRIWDIDTCSLVRTMEGHKCSIRAIKTISNSSFAIIVADDPHLFVWDLKTRCLIKTHKKQDNSADICALNLNGEYIISGRKRILQIRDYKTGNLIRTLEGHKGYINAIALIQNGEFIVGGASDFTIRIWDFNTGQLVRTLDKHKGKVNAVVTTQDGKFIVSGADDCTARIWDFNTGELVRTLDKHNGKVNAVAIAQDSKFIVSGADDCIVRIWDFNTGELVRTLEEHKGKVNAIAITPDDKFIVSGADNGTICITNMGTFDVYTIQIFPLSFINLDFSKAIISTPELKEQLRLNGAKV